MFFVISYACLMNGCATVAFRDHRRPIKSECPEHFHMRTSDEDQIRIWLIVKEFGRYSLTGCPDVKDLVGI